MKKIDKEYIVKLLKTLTNNDNSFEIRFEAA